MSAAQLSDPLADAVLHSWRTRQDLDIEPGQPVAAIAVPEAVITELGMPARCFDRVAEIWEQAVRRAVAETVTLARELAA